MPCFVYNIISNSQVEIDEGDGEVERGEEGGATEGGGGGEINVGAIAEECAEVGIRLTESSMPVDGEIDDTGETMSALSMPMNLTSAT